MLLFGDSTQLLVLRWWAVNVVDIANSYYDVISQSTGVFDTILELEDGLS